MFAKVRTSRFSPFCIIKMFLHKPRSGDQVQTHQAPVFVRDLLNRAPKFIIVGTMATLVHFLTLVFLVHIAGMPWPTFASAIGSVAGIVTSYFGNYAWTFARTEPHLNFVLHFTAAYGLTISSNTLLMYIEINLLQFNYIAAFLIATSLSTMINFY